MYVCMYACVCVYTCMYMYVCVYTYMYVCICLFVGVVGVDVVNRKVGNVLFNDALNTFDFTVIWRQTYG